MVVLCPRSTCICVFLGLAPSTSSFGRTCTCNGAQRRPRHCKSFQTNGNRERFLIVSKWLWLHYGEEEIVGEGTHSCNRELEGGSRQGDAAYNVEQQWSDKLASLYTGSVKKRVRQAIQEPKLQINPKLRKKRPSHQPGCCKYDDSHKKGTPP